MVFVVLGSLDIGEKAENGLYEINAKESEEVDEGGDQSDDCRQIDDMEGSGVADLLAPPRQQEVELQEEEREEHRIGQIQRQRQSIRRFGLHLIIDNHSHFHRCSGFVRQSPAHVHSDWRQRGRR